MKIIHVTRQFYPAVGGIPSAIAHLTRHLQRRGHQVEVVALNRLFQGDRSPLPPLETIEGITIRRIPYFGSRRYAIAPTVLGIVKEYDLIHIHSSDFFLDYLALTYPLHKRPMVLTSHGLFFHTSFARRFKQFYFRAITRSSLQRIGAVICVSEHDLALLKTVAPTEKLFLLPDGIDYDRLAQLSVEGRDPDSFLSIGLLAPHKGHDRLLKVFAYIVSENPRAHLTIVGPDRGCLAALQKQVKDLGITEQVKFTGRVSNQKLTSHLRMANVWLSASRYEGFGIALVEAMASGCVPLVHPLPSFKRILDVHRFPMLFTDFDSPHEAARAALALQTLAKAERQNLVGELRSLASLYSWTSIVERTEAIYNQII